LADSLGGNCKTTFMAMVTPTPECYGESLSTLKFANRTKNIKNKVQINEDLNQNAILRKYQNEILSLKGELTKVHNSGINKRIEYLEREKRIAEEDKEAAIGALYQRSQELLKEREQKT